MTRLILPLAALALMLSFTARQLSAGDLESALDIVREVQANGAGNAQAQSAMREVVQTPAADIVTILSAIDGAQPLAANWLRSAVDAIAEQAFNSGDGLPVAKLESFLANTDGDARARRLAYELVQRADPEKAAQLLGSFLNDPSVELRRDAVADAIERASSKLDQDDKAAAKGLYQQALGGARDEDQIKEIVKQLRSLDVEVDLPRHFGFLTSWRIVGPFHNAGGEGFQAVFPPENELQAGGQYDGLEGTVSWTDYSTDDDYGMVNVNDVLGSKKEVTAYAWTQYNSPSEQEVELRLGCKNAWKVWVNGELLFGRDEYHRGMRIDQYRMHAKLRAGANDILVKVCQNEQVEPWTVEWQFQLRVCDNTGTAILARAE